MVKKHLLVALLLSVWGVWAAETLPPVNREDWAGRYYAELTAKAESLQGSTVPVVFLGDSITHAWAWKSDVKYPGGREVWDTALAEFSPLNLGVSGDTVANVLWRVTAGKQLDGYQARVIVLMIGVNDLLRSHGDLGHAEKVAATHALLVETIQARQPQAKILVLSILPFKSERLGSGSFVNERIRQACDGHEVIYLDMRPDFLDAEGQLINMRDGLHPAPSAYTLMANRLIPVLRDLLKP